MGLKLAALTVAANGGGTVFIDPPDDTEEWELQYLYVNDRNSVDVGDVVEFYMIDQLVTSVVPLQQTAVAGGTVPAGNGVLFPNRDTASARLGLVTSVSDMGFIVKRRDSKTSWMQMACRYAASAVAGTRTVDVYWVYRRRRLK